MPLPRAADGDPTIDAPFTTDGIVLIEEKEGDGWKVRLYRQSAYRCGINGSHVFVVLTPPGTDWSTPLPLFFALHGGGVGLFDEKGNYFPERLAQSRLQDEPSAELLVRRFSLGAGEQDYLNPSAPWPPQQGLQKLVAQSHRFRIVLPSMCDNDVYSGAGKVDVYNPNAPEGAVPRVDGLLATRAAFEFVTATFPTTQRYLKGCSAGAVGVMSLAHRLSRENITVSGVVADSAVIHPAWKTLWARGASGDTCFSWHVSDPALHEARIGPMMAEENHPHRVVERGAMASPVHLVWSTHDALFCAEAGLVFADLSAALRSKNPGGASAVSEVCTDADCSAHCPLDSDSIDSNTGQALPASVFEWVNARN